MNDKGPGEGASADQQRQEHLSESERIRTAYDDKTALLNAIGLKRRPRMTADEIRRAALWARMVDGRPRHRCQCDECQRWWRRWAA
jgi:hypothetical protein